MAIKTADETFDALKVLPEFVAAEQFINTNIIPQFTAKKSHMIWVPDVAKHSVEMRRTVVYLLAKAGYGIQYDREQYNVWLKAE